MEKFSAHVYLAIGRLVERVSSFHAKDPSKALDNDDVWALQQFVSSIDKEIKKIGLRFSRVQVKRIAQKLSENPTNQEISNLLKELETRIRDEMKANLFLFVPSERADSYDKPELLGKKVTKKFHSIQFDVVEAGNCYAAGRGTAVVFHLMRIMEVGVQEFGNKLGIPLANEKNWQNILDEVNKKIKALPPKDSKTVELSQASANLYAVKLAWRNEVMHPKDTYTLEEADNLIRQVKLFMEQLATII